MYVSGLGRAHIVPGIWTCSVSPRSCCTRVLGFVTFPTRHVYSAFDFRDASVGTADCRIDSVCLMCPKGASCHCVMRSLTNSKSAPMSIPAQANATSVLSSEHVCQNDSLPAGTSAMETRSFDSSGVEGSLHQPANISKVQAVPHTEPEAGRTSFHQGRSDSEQVDDLRLKPPCTSADSHHCAVLGCDDVPLPRQAAKTAPHHRVGPEAAPAAGFAAVTEVAVGTADATAAVQAGLKSQDQEQCVLHSAVKETSSVAAVKSPRRSNEEHGHANPAGTAAWTLHLSKVRYGMVAMDTHTTVNQDPQEFAMSTILAI